MIISKALVSKTHTSEYLLHKYWARKPHNIISKYIKDYFKPGDVVCDPFCGSGVFLAEAKKQNINSIGFDINPIATLISEVTLNPPDADTLAIELNRILGLVEDK